MAGISTNRTLPPTAQSSLRIPLLSIPIAILAFGVIFVWLAPVADPLEAFLAGANLTICMAGIIYASARGLQPVALIFFVFSFGWLAFAPVYQLITNRLAWGDTIANHEPSSVTNALLLNLALSVTFFLSHHLAQQGAPAKSAPVVVSGRYLAVLVVVAAVVSVVAVRQIGGLAVLFSSRGERWEALAGIDGNQAGGVTDALTRVLPAALAMAFAVLVLFWIRQTWVSWRRVRASQLILALSALTLLVLFANPFSASRFIAATAWGALVLVALRPRSVRAGVVSAVVGLIAILVVYPFANVFRQGADSSVALRTGLEAFVGPDFDGFQQVVNTLELVDQHGHTFGKYLLSAAGFFVPRSVWEDKASPASIDVATNAGYWFTNLSLPIHAELYLEFGFIGVVVGIAALGYLCGRSDAAWLRGDQTRWAIVAPYLAFSMLGILRGPLGSLVPIYITAIVLLLLGLRSVRTALSTRSDRLHQKPVDS